MADMINIAVDLHVYKAIEAKRSSFAQSHNDIMRELLNFPNSSAAPNITQPTKNGPSNQYTRKRVTGSYDFLLLGKRHHSSNLKESYLKCLRELSSKDPSFLELLSQVETSARRIISKDPAKLYLKSPHLAESHAEKLNDEWWVDINLSQQQVESRLNDASKIAKLRFGSDLLLDFPDE